MIIGWQIGDIKSKVIIGSKKILAGLDTRVGNYYLLFSIKLILLQ